MIKKTPDAVKLLNPGPVTLSARVREALRGPDLCHREPEFATLQTEIRTRLAQVYPEAERDFVALLLTGSGTAAVEAMVGSLVPARGHALVVANGVYGERMAAMLELQGKVVYVAAAPWTEPINLAAAENILVEHTQITHVLAVHHETTTGRLNDIEALGALCRKYGRALLLDAVSSFGGERIDFSGWNLEACAATANKCLHGVPGISFVLVRRDTLLARESGASSLYLDLFRHYPEQQKGSTAFTQSVQVCYALREALRELAEAGGWRSRRARYRAHSERIFAGLKALDIMPLLALERPSSAILTSYHVPRGRRYAELHDYLKKRGFIIYAGQGRFSEEIFRIAVMGDFETADADRLLSTFREFIAARESFPCTK